MTAALALQGLSTGLGLLRGMERRWSAKSGGADEAQQARQNLPGGKDDLAQLFAAMDSDKSGGVSKDEFTGFLSAPAPDTAGAMIALQQASDPKALAAKLFDSLDKDKDGSLSKEEIAAGLKQAGGRRPHRHGEGKGQPDMDALFKTVDANGDGSLSKDELTAALKQADIERGRDRLWSLVAPTKAAATAGANAYAQVAATTAPAVSGGAV